MIVARDAPSIPALATAIAAGAAATTLAVGPELPNNLAAQIPSVTTEQRAAIAQGYQSGLAVGVNPSSSRPGQFGEVQELMRSLAVGPHGLFARLGCTAALLGAFACKKAAAASDNAVLQVGGDLAYTSSKLAVGLISHDFRVVDAALAYGTVAAQTLEIGHPGLTTAIDAATAGADLALDHPDAITALTDIAALQLIPTATISGNV